MPVDLSHEFPLDTDLCYLNHAAIGVWPRRTGDAVKAFAEENVHRGAANWPQWARTEQRTREQFAKLVNARSADDIALLKNTSEALSVVAWGLPWEAGDNVVLAFQEFPSNRMVWESLARIGVEARIVDLSGAEDPEARLIEAMDRSTRILTVSSVQYGDGLRMDLERLGEHCRRNGSLFCVDAIQSLGALPLDVRECGADFAMADGHKWLLGPEGVTAFYSRPDAREQLALHQYGWRMVDDPFRMDHEDWEPSATARRFEAGSANTLGLYAQQASLSLLDEMGMDEVARRVLDNAGCLMDGLDEMDGVTLLSDRRPERRSGIVTFRPGRADTGAVYKALMKNRVICARRGGGIRLSPHFYTPREQLQRALEMVGELAGG